MTTYGDLMSLLLVFFILLVSFSTMEIVKFRKAMGSMRGGEGVLSPNTGNTIVEMPVSPESQEFEAALDELVEMLEEQELSEHVRVYWDSQGVRIVLQNEILFRPGRANIRSQFLPVLDAVITVIKTLPVEELQIEGHTDDTPIHTERYPSNWELSVDRAISVLRYVEDKRILPQRKLVALGYGEFRPYLPNDSAENKAKNRRVEFYVLKRR